MQQHDPRDLGRQLQNARKACGLKQEDAAKSLGVGRTTMTAIEKGERQIQPAEVLKLARLYKRSIGDLFRKPVSEESFVVQLRVAQMEAPAADLMAPCIAEFQRLCEDYCELERLCGVRVSTAYPSPYTIEGLEPEEAAEDLAVVEHNRLGLGDGPVLNLREVLENDVGLRVFLMDLPPWLAAMFACTETLKGCIAVNRRHPSDRRRNSLAHEYGHFLTTRYAPEVTHLARYQRQPRNERFADAFAVAFLLPATGLRRRFHELKRQKQNVSATDLCVLANYYHVSLETLINRLEALRLIQVGTWASLQGAGFRGAAARFLPTLPERPDDVDPLPPRYLYLATDALMREEISEGQYARFLRRDRVEARRMAQELAATSIVSDEGVLESLVLPLGESLKS